MYICGVHEKAIRRVCMSFKKGERTNTPASTVLLQLAPAPQFTTTPSVNGIAPSQGFGTTISLRRAQGRHARGKQSMVGVGALGRLPERMPAMQGR